MNDILTTDSTGRVKQFPLNELIQCSFEEYAEAPGLNQSKLKDVLKSPRHYYSRHVLNEKEDKETEALRFGRVVHAAVLEPADFHARKAVEPVCDKRTKEGKALQEQYLKSLKADSIQCKESDLIAVTAMLDSLSLHAEVKRLLSVGQREVSIWWHEPVYGILCKARFDFVCDLEPVIIDLKTTEDAGFVFFLNQVVNYGYHFQAAWYLKALHEALGLAPEPYSFMFVAIEKQAPYELMAYRAGAGIIARGNKLIESALSQFNACCELDEWPGYSRTVQVLELP